MRKEDFGQADVEQVHIEGRIPEVLQSQAPEPGAQSSNVSLCRKDAVEAADIARAACDLRRALPERQVTQQTASFKGSGPTGRSPFFIGLQCT